MNRERSLLIVNFRSAGHTVRAIESGRAASSQPLHVVVVDNSCDPAEVEALRDSGADRVIVAERNLGYGGAVNRGVAECQGDDLVISNPDIRFRAEAIDRLIEEIHRGAAMSGPAFFWDDRDRWHLPPPDVPGLRAKLSELLALRSRFWARQRGRARIRRRTRFWELARPTPQRVVSGAVLCLSRRRLTGIGGFDERFQLYFEEVDLMRRIRDAGGEVVYVPAARCRHLYNQSAGTDEGAALLWARSELEYYRKWHGAGALRLMRILGRPGPAQEDDGTVERSGAIRLPEGEDPSGWLVEASPFPHFDSAAGCFPEDLEVAIPSEVLDSLHGGALHLRLIRRADATVWARARVR